jgi:hypothetical protein
LGRSAAAIEAELLQRADAQRGGGTWMHGLTHAADHGDREVDGHTVTIGAHMVRCVWNPTTMPVGPSTAPRACEFWRYVEREFGADIGPLSPAPDVTAVR